MKIKPLNNLILGVKALSDALKNASIGMKDFHRQMIVIEAISLHTARALILIRFYRVLNEIVEQNKR